MYLAIVIVALIALAGLVIKNKLEKPSPPIKDLDEELRTLTQLNSQKERQKYLKQRRKNQN